MKERKPSPAILNRWEPLQFSSHIGAVLQIGGAYLAVDNDKLNFTFSTLEALIHPGDCVLLVCLFVCLLVCVFVCLCAGIF